MPKNPQHLSQTAELGTPPEVIEAGRDVLGAYTLDPASDALFNTAVGADRYYTAKDNGFTKSWYGNVFLNPPGGLCDKNGRTVVRVEHRGYCYPNGKKAEERPHSAAALWWFKLAQEWYERRIRAGLFVGFSLEIMQKAQQMRLLHLVPTDFAFCIPAKRMRFYYKRGRSLVRSKSPTHANIIILLPEMQQQVVSFQRTFEKIGEVVVPAPRTVR